MKIMLIAALMLSVACSSTSKTQTEDEYIDAMAKEHSEDTADANESQKQPLNEVTTKEVVYATINGVEVKGHMAMPANATGDEPAVIMIHEWWGLNENIKNMADQLAAEGYVTLAVDLYTGESATTPEDATKLMQASMQNKELLEDNLKQAFAFLEGQGKTKVGIMGWCFGGMWSLNASIMSPDKIDATVIYYGRVIDDPVALEKLNMPVLGIFAAEDKGIPVEGVKSFESALVDLGKNAEIIIYPGVDHAFANPSGNNYSKAEAEDAWAKTLAFFRDNL